MILRLPRQYGLNQSPDIFGMVLAIAESLEALAKMNSVGGAFERATRLFAAASVLREAISFAMTSAESEESDRDVAAILVQLNEAAFAAEQAAGWAMTMEQAVAFALRD